MHTVIHLALVHTSIDYIIVILMVVFCNNGNNFINNSLDSEVHKNGYYTCLFCSKQYKLLFLHKIKASQIVKKTLTNIDYIKGILKWYNNIIIPKMRGIKSKRS